MHNNDPDCVRGESDCWQANEDRAAAVNAKVKSLAPVLNTQSYYNSTYEINGWTYYEYRFDNGTDAMLKTYDGRAYIFAGIGLLDSPGDKTFAVPEGVIGTTVTVEDEDRTIPVVDGAFTDYFAAEYSHHVYSIECPAAATELHAAGREPRWITVTLSAGGWSMRLPGCEPGAVLEFRDVNGKTAFRAEERSGYVVMNACVPHSGMFFCTGSGNGTVVPVMVVK